MRHVSIDQHELILDWTNLERVLAGEALIAMAARERLDGQMYPLVSLEVVVAVEALWALIASERSVVLWVGLLRMVAIQLVHGRGVTAVERWHHAMRHAASHQCNWTVWLVDIGEHRHRVAVRSMLGVLWLLLRLEGGDVAVLIHGRHLGQRSSRTDWTLLHVRSSRVRIARLLWRR